MELKGVILAGGTGSRLYPLTKVTNKHLLPVGKKPMIFWPIEKLVEVGINEILVVTGTEHMGDVVALLGSGKDFGCNFTYKVQDEPGGIAQALGLAENFASGSKLAVILGDNIFADPLKPYVDRFLSQKDGARIVLKRVEHPERFGVAQFEGDKIIKIVEKPKIPPSSYAVTGVYFYDSEVFDIIKNLKPSKRMEYEISDVNNEYIRRNKLYADFFESWWTDAGTFSSLKRAQKLVEELENGKRI